VEVGQATLPSPVIIDEPHLEAVARFGLQVGVAHHFARPADSTTSPALGCGDPVFVQLTQIRRLERTGPARLERPAIGQVIVDIDFRAEVRTELLVIVVSQTTGDFQTVADMNLIFYKERG